MFLDASFTSTLGFSGASRRRRWVTGLRSDRRDPREPRALRTRDRLRSAIGFGSRPRTTWNRDGRYRCVFGSTSDARTTTCCWTSRWAPAPGKSGYAISPGATARTRVGFGIGRGRRDGNDPKGRPIRRRPGRSADPAASALAGRHCRHAALMALATFSLGAKALCVTGVDTSRLVVARRRRRHLVGPRRRHLRPWVPDVSRGSSLRVATVVDGPGIPTRRGRAPSRAGGQPDRRASHSPGAAVIGDWRSRPSESPRRRRAADVMGSPATKQSSATRFAAQRCARPSLPEARVVGLLDLARVGRGPPDRLEQSERVDQSSEELDAEPGDALHHARGPAS